MNDRLTKTEQTILTLLIENNDYNADEPASKIHVTRRTIERSISGLQKKGKIERIGSKRNGKWSVIK